MKTFEFFHGAALLRVINSQKSQIESYTKNNSSYVVDNKIGLYFKYSQKRISPWSFSFLEEHIIEIKQLKSNFEKVFIIFICNDNGICCLSFAEFSTVISIENKIYPKWLKASRLKGEKYFVSGSDGELNHKIGDIDFPRKIYE